MLRDTQDTPIALAISSRFEPSQWTHHSQGAYLLRTNCTETDPAQLWRWYVQLAQAEAALRTAKSDLKLRPVSHQKTERVEAHILSLLRGSGVVARARTVDARQGLGDLCA